MEPNYATIFLNENKITCSAGKETEDYYSYNRNPVVKIVGINELKVPYLNKGENFFYNSGANLTVTLNGRGELQSYQYSLNSRYGSGCVLLGKNFDRSGRPSVFRAETDCRSMQIPVKGFLSYDGKQIENRQTFDIDKGTTFEISIEGYYNYDGSSGMKLQSSGYSSGGISGDSKTILVQNFAVPIIWVMQFEGYCTGCGPEYEYSKTCLKGKFKPPTFHKNGLLKSGVIAPDHKVSRYRLKTKKGDTQTVLGYDMIFLDENGNLEKVNEDLCSK